MKALRYSTTAAEFVWKMCGQMRTAIDQEDAGAILRRTPLRDRATGKSGAYDQNVVDGHAAFDHRPNRKVFLWECYHSHAVVDGVDEFAEKPAFSSPKAGQGARFSRVFR